MFLSDDAMLRFIEWLMAIMQLSILVPAAVVWRRQRYFSAPVRMLSWYVYLSAAASLGGHYAVPLGMQSNHIFNAGFNFGKVLLFGCIYYQLLAWRRLVRVIVPAALVLMAVSFGYDGFFGVAVARVLQCAVLAGLSILYLEQYSDLPTARTSTEESFWLLSISQLIYSATTVTAFSLDYLSKTANQMVFKYLFIAIGGLAFNSFLTMLFLRARPAEPLTPAAA